MCALADRADLGLKISTPIGTLVGQLLFGWLADVYGRKRMYGIELMIIIVGTLAQAVSGSGPALTLLGVLIMWRFIMVRRPSSEPADSAGCRHRRCACALHDSS